LIKSERNIRQILLIGFQPEGLEISSVDDTWVEIRASMKASAEDKLGNSQTKK
jgi:hypothetical protein